jgi:hypothetical protein
MLQCNWILIGGLTDAPVAFARRGKSRGTNLIRPVWRCGLMAEMMKIKLEGEFSVLLRSALIFYYLKLNWAHFRLVSI